MFRPQFWISGDALVDDGGRQFASLQGQRGKVCPVLLGCVEETVAEGDRLGTWPLEFAVPFLIEWARLLLLGLLTEQCGADSREAQQRPEGHLCVGHGRLYPAFV